MSAIWAFRFKRLSGKLSCNKGLPTDLALKLTFSAIVIVNIMVRRTTYRANSINRNRLTIASLDSLKGFSVFKLIT
ncbi:hypothetical protein Q428_14285 [Fervidicella metallireducens AeB]|uniref:Uncharacterized protein n=2 Tax=Fervidicella TaxID=1403538 RepID=A0A017RRM6_9CLOT|nr:hypothetical protein Q428_14285 [Fervidicella metallireducens AeB]